MTILVGLLGTKAPGHVKGVRRDSVYIRSVTSLVVKHGLEVEVETRRRSRQSKRGGVVCRYRDRHCRSGLVRKEVGY